MNSRDKACPKGPKTILGILLVLFALCLMMRDASAATVPARAGSLIQESVLPTPRIQDFVKLLSSDGHSWQWPQNEEKRTNPMNCIQRCETHDILVFKSYWRMKYPQMHFIEFLRDLVVCSAYYPELRDFKPMVDRAVQGYEICRYITCSTDYLG